MERMLEKDYTDANFNSMTRRLAIPHFPQFASCQPLTHHALTFLISSLFAHVAYLRAEVKIKDKSTSIPQEEVK